MAPITTVIFDAYETLAHNNQGLWLEIFGRTCQAQGLGIDSQLLYLEWKALEMVFRKERQNVEEPEKSPPFKSYEEAWRDCFRDVFSKLGIHGDAASAAKEAVRDMGERQPYQDALEVLPAIQSRWRTGVLSNADDNYLLPLLKNAGWNFEAVLSSEAARAYKPLPSAFWQIMRLLGVEPHEVVYVGDSLHDDVLGAKGVGMKAAWVNRHGAPPDPAFPEPDYVIGSLGELPELLDAGS